METLRQTTKSSKISDIVNGTYVRKEGMEPSYVLTKMGERISRTKLVGTVIDKFMSEDGGYSSVTIDDDSDSIRAKAFQEDADFFDDFEKGDFVMLIGKVREYNEENYIIPEIMRKVDKDYESLHRLKILKNFIQKKKINQIVQKQKDKFADLKELKKYLVKKQKFDEEEVEGVLETLGEKTKKKEKDYKPLLLELIEKTDKGEGVPFKKLLEKSKLEESIFQETMNELLTDGICYEPKPLVVKKV
jgi:RPA family protein